MYCCNTLYNCCFNHIFCNWPAFSRRIDIFYNCTDHVGGSRGFHNNNSPNDTLSKLQNREENGKLQHYEDSVAQELEKKIRVICWIMTCPDNHMKKSRHVKATWGKRYNTLLFMSSVEDESLPTIALPVGEGRKYLWGKTKEAFKYIHNHYNDYDYVLKADDDTYFVVENLRYLLQSYDPKNPVYLGCKFKPFVKHGYMSGGAGYFLSKESVKMFVEEAIPREEYRQDPGGNEDVEMANCLQLVGVEAGDSRDGSGRERFLALNLAFFIYHLSLWIQTIGCRLLFRYCDFIPLCRT